LRILVVSQYFWPENFRINDLVKDWCLKGYSVTVVTGIPNYPAGQVFEDYKRSPQSYTYYEGALVVRTPMVTRGESVIRLLLNYMSFIVCGSIWGAVGVRKQNFDMIFVFEPSPITVGLPALLFGRLKQAPVVFWALDLWPETLAAVGFVKSQVGLRLVGRLVRFIYNRCTLVLGQSRSFLPSIAKYCDDNTKIRYFPSWSEEVYDSSSVEVAPEVPQRTDLFNVLFAGNIGDAQDMPSILRAAEILKENSNIRWLVVGDGRKYEWMKAEVEARGLQKQVLLLGRYHIDRMPSFYLHADALLVSLKRDPVFSLTIPGKVQSYLASGIPILGMLDGEGADVVLAANAGLVCSAGASSNLADNVLKMANMSSYARNEMGISGRVFSQQEFSRKGLLDKLDDLLDEATAIYADAEVHQ